MELEVQQLYLQTVEGTLVAYSLIIPIDNMSGEYDVAVTDAQNVAFDCSTTSSGEYVVKRNDPIGQYTFTVSVKRKRDGAICNAKQIAVTVLDGASSAIVDEVRASCAPIGGNVGAAWQEPTRVITAKLWEKFGSDLVPAIGTLFFESRTDLWPKYGCVLINLIPHVNKDKKHAELALSIFEKAVEWAKPGDKFHWWDSGTHVQVPAVRMNRFCLSALKNGANVGNVIGFLQATTPGSMKAAVAEEVIAEGVITNWHIELVKNFNFRAGLPMLLEVLRGMRPGDGDAVGLMNLMAEWEYREGAQAIVDLLDMAIDANVCRSAVAALKKFEYRSAMPALKLMIPVSAPIKASLIEGLLKEWGAL